MTDPVTTRNIDVRPGHDLHASIDLPGWDDRSIWGYDHGLTSFYAQLWRNPGTGNAPDIWLSGHDPRYPWPACIALAIVDATGREPASIIRALGLRQPHPTPRPIAEIVRAVTTPTAAHDPYTAGRQAAFDWVTGLATITPGSRRPWTAAQPSAEQVRAEHYMITARLYQALDEQTRAWTNGVDDALTWMLSGT
jgi:hypothetical protein